MASTLLSTAKDDPINFCRNLWCPETQQESQLRKEHGSRRKMRKGRATGEGRAEGFGGHVGAADVATRSTRIRMHAALRWRNSFRGTRAPDHISCTGTRRAQDLCQRRRTGPTSFWPVELNHRELRNRELSPRFRTAAPRFVGSKDPAGHLGSWAISNSKRILRLLVY